MTQRIAMWSGPRNLSTAMMYSFGARADTRVVDEPFYAAYLSLSGAQHPMRDDILRQHETDAKHVASALLQPVPEPVFYQKHMAHHMIDGVPRDWMSQVTNVYLIRHPARVVASYLAKREHPTLEDLGYPQLAQLYAAHPGPVIDSARVREDPETMLRVLCGAVGIPWDPAMLSWPSGGRPEDGVWAAHWYGAVHQSTGFAGPEGPLPDLSDHPLVSAAMPYYSEMSALSLRHAQPE